MQPKLAHSSYYRFPGWLMPSSCMVLYPMIIWHWQMWRIICKLTIGSEGLQGAVPCAPSQVPPCYRCCCWQGQHLVQAQGRMWPCCLVAVTDILARIVLPANSCAECYSCIYVKPPTAGQGTEKTITFMWQHCGCAVTAWCPCSSGFVTTFLLVEVKRYTIFPPSQPIPRNSLGICQVV